MIPFIELPRPLSPEVVTKELLERIRLLCKLPFSKDPNRSVLAADLLGLGFQNEAAFLGNWGETKTKVTPTAPVSVYVPCFNGARFLDETLRAILNQSYPPCEILVVDDCSTDDSLAVASRYPVRVLRHPERKGLSAARNTALGAAGGMFIAGVDADVTPDIFWIERLMEGFSDNAVICTGGRLVENGLSIADSWRRYFLPQHHGDKPLRGDTIFTSNSIFRTRALRDLGGFKETCRQSYREIELTNRILTAGFTTAYVPKAVCYNGRSDTSHSIVEHAYRSRITPFELEGSWDSKSLAVRWHAIAGQAVKEMEDLFREGNSHLLFISYSLVFVSIVIDLITFYRTEPTRERQLLVRSGVALVLRAVHALRNVNQQTKDELTKRVVGRFIQDIPETLVMEGIVAAVEKYPNAEDLVRAISVPITDEVAVVVFSLSGLGENLTLSPEMAREVDQSAMKVCRDDILQETSLRNGTVVIASKEAAKNEWGAHAVRTFGTSASQEGVDARILISDRSGWRAFEILYEAQSATPHEVRLFFTEAELPEAIGLLVCLQCRLPHAGVTITTQ